MFLVWLLVVVLDSQTKHSVIIGSGPVQAAFLTMMRPTVVVTVPA